MFSLLSIKQLKQICHGRSGIFFGRICREDRFGCIHLAIVPDNGESKRRSPTTPHTAILEPFWARLPPPIAALGQQ